MQQKREMTFSRGCITMQVKVILRSISIQSIEMKKYENDCLFNGLKDKISKVI